MQTYFCFTFCNNWYYNSSISSRFAINLWGCRSLKNYVLKELRGKQTLQEVADKIGIPKSTYACIESGIRRGRLETMNKICKFYGVSIEQTFLLENKS